mgnify:FL=1
MRADKKLLIKTLEVQGTSCEVIKVFRDLPRERFLSPDYNDLAYADRALPIESGQTISQPSLVGLITDLIVAIKPKCVLEVGTGSGYQAAILGKLSVNVVSIELHPNLAESARERLKSLNICNVSVFDAEETIGWKQHAPYDGIVVSAAAPSIPKSLIQQLKNGGRMVIPLGDKFSQQLTLVKKHENKITTEKVNEVRFVPLIGKGVWDT